MKDTELFGLMSEIDDDLIDSVPDDLNKSKNSRMRKTVISAAVALAAIGAVFFAWSAVSGRFGTPEKNLAARNDYDSINAGQMADNTQTDTIDAPVPSETDNDQPPLILQSEEGLFLKRFIDVSELGGSGYTYPITKKQFYKVFEDIPEQLIISPDDEIPEYLPIFRLSHGTGFGGCFEPLTDEEKQNVRDRLADTVRGLYGDDIAETTEIRDVKQYSEEAPYQCFCDFKDESGNKIEIKCTENGFSVFFGWKELEYPTEDSDISPSNKLDPERITQSVKDNTTVQKVLDYIGFESPVYLSSKTISYTSDKEQEIVEEANCNIFDASEGKFWLSGIGKPVVWICNIPGFSLFINVSSPNADIIEYAKTGTTDDAMATLKKWIQGAEELCDLENVKIIMTYRKAFWEYGDNSVDYPREGEDFLVPVYEIYIEGTGDVAGRYIMLLINATDFDVSERNPHR